MKIVYATQPVATSLPSIFLAGPTPRAGGPESWRPEALNILKELGFKGIVYVPEPENGVWPENYDDQANWEYEALHNSDLVVFWVPRSELLPDYTTNVEFGYWVSTGKVLYGRPNGALRTRYLDWMYRKEIEAEPFSELQPLLSEAISVALVNHHHMLYKNTWS